MQLSQMSGLRQRATAKVLIFLISALLTVLAGEVRAETAYVTQVPVKRVNDISVPKTQPAQPSFAQLPSAKNATLPEGSVSMAGRNYASTLEIGARNTVFTAQGGANSISTAGVVGNDNNVTVLQGGNNLKSNVVLLNASNMNVGVIQPRGSAPVNVLIVRLPGGGLLIKR